MKTTVCVVPDVIIISSCLWDVNRRGPDCQELYEENLHSLVGDVSCHLPNTRILWLTSLPGLGNLYNRIRLQYLHFSCQ